MRLLYTIGSFFSLIFLLQKIGKATTFKVEIKFERLFKELEHVFYVQLFKF